MTRPFSSIELFTGAGGLALGVQAAGFQHRLLLEYNRDACATLRLNHATFGTGNCAFHEGDVHDYEFASLGDVDLLAAGAPCQPFSIGGKHRADNDERNLFPEVFRAVRELRPRAVLIENVKGLLRASLREFVEYVELQLAYPDVLPRGRHRADDWISQLPRLRAFDREKRAGSELVYRVHKILLNAADFGVPQRRERVFFVALRSDVNALWVGPDRTHSAQALRVAQQITGEYWKRHGIARKVSRGHPMLGKWTREAGISAPWVTVRDALIGLPEPSSGRSAAGVANHLVQPGARSYPGHTGSPLDQPAKTLKAGVHGVPGGENMLRRPNGTVRYFTIREAARLQTFPDSYVFTGAWGEAMRQIGNAVPVKLAQAVAESIRRCLAPAQRIDARRREPRLADVQEALPGI
jgi:DNA (cytosine-5)-methyltransferase 1